MSNGKKVSSKISAGIFSVTLLASLSLFGCGQGGQGGAGSPLMTTSAAPTIPDTTPPTVSSTSPANAATGVALNSSVSASFSEAMMNSSLSSASFTLATTTGSAAVAGTVIVSGNTAMFVPSINLAASTQYTATITTAAKDAAGNALAANYTWQFNSGAALDTTPPTVSATSPPNATNGVATNSSVSATFSEPMTNSTLNTASFTLVTTTGGAARSGTVSVSGNTATFTPFAPLAASTQYTATIAAGVTDAAGNALAANFPWQFTTGAAPDTTPPTVSSTSPTNGANGVATNASVSATFSEAMTNSTLTTASVKLATTSGAAVAGTVNVNGTTATFTPSAALAGGTQYTATITTAAKDAAGNALVADYVWNFTTGVVPDTTAPSTPAGLTASAVSQSQINLSWSASTDNVAVTGYRVYRGGALITTVGTVTTYQNTGLSASTSYTYTVQAIDAAGNASGQSTVASATTLGTPTATGTAILAWDPVTVANLSGYRVYYGNAPGTYFQPLGQGLSVGNVTTHTVTGLTGGTRYYFVVTAVDTSNNESTYSNEVFKDIP